MSLFQIILVNNLIPTWRLIYKPGYKQHSKLTFRNVWRHVCFEKRIKYVNKATGMQHASENNSKYIIFVIICFQ
jgi:hypothetical protein